MADGVDEPEEAAGLGEKEKLEIAKWFLTNAPAGEIHYVAKGTPSSLFLSPSLSVRVLFLIVEI